MKGWGKRLTLFFGCLTTAAIGYRFGGFAAWFVLYSLFGALLYAIGLTLFSIRGLNVRRVLSASTGIAGNDLQVSVSVSYRSLLPLPWLVLKEDWQHVGSGQSLTFKKLLFPWFRRSHVVRYRIAGLQRGIYEFAGFEAHTGDLFGFAAIKRTASAPVRFVVYPKPAELPGRAMSFQSGGERSASSGPLWITSAAASGIREYRQGDPLNRIHWKSAARLGRLMTKEPESAASQKLMLLLDAAPAAPAEACGPLLEQRVALAAGCFAAAAAARQSCGFAGSSSPRRIAPTIRSDLALAYEVLASVGGRPALPFPDLVRKEAAALPPDASMLCITSTLGGFLLRAVAEARSRKRSVHVVYVHAGASLSVADREGAASLQALGCSFTEAPHPRRGWRPGHAVVDETGRSSHAARQGGAADAAF